MLAPAEIVYRETFKVPCAHKECKTPVTVVVERIKGGGTSMISVTHDQPTKS